MKRLRAGGPCSWLVARGQGRSPAQTIIVTHYKIWAILAIWQIADKEFLKDEG